jgi:TonB family protein
LIARPHPRRHEGRAQCIPLDGAEEVSVPSFHTRRTASTPRRVVRALAIGAALSIASRLAAQQAGLVKIAVKDSIGHAIVGAELAVEGTQVHTVTDDKGEARFNAVQLGPTTIHVRRLGFQPASVDLTVDPRVPATATVTLNPIAQRLSPVLIRGSSPVYEGRMAGFYQRRDQGIGHFVTRERLEKENPAMLTDVFRRIPGVQITSTRLIRNAVRMRGMRCWPLVWLDGAPLPSGEFDLDNLSPTSLEGVEIYTGVSQVPPQFMGTRGMGSCGVVVVWSREGERREKKRKTQVTAAQLAEMVASLKVYTAEQVDIAARFDSTSLKRPLYPEKMFADGRAGEVQVEFVVDTLGQPDMDTFGVVSSTHPDFTASVKRAVTESMFAPAMLKGHRVRQLMQLPYRFVMDSTAKRRR